MSDPTPLTYGAFKQIMSDAGATDATVLVVDSGWVKAVDPNDQEPWQNLYQATPFLTDAPGKQSIVLLS